MGGEVHWGRRLCRSGRGDPGVLIVSSGSPQACSNELVTAARPRSRAILAVALVVVLFAGLLTVAGDADRGGPLSQPLTDASGEGAMGTADALADSPVGELPATVPSTSLALADTEPPSSAPPTSSVPVSDPAPPITAASPLVVPDPGPPPSQEDTPDPGFALPTTVVAASAGTPLSQSEQTFASEHPAHAAARQRDGDASSFHWAVIIGVNDYMGRTSSTIGSVSDALVLRDTLYREGWKGEQVLTLTDRAATHDAIVRAIEWLIRSTDERSTVLFSFSGHMRHNSGVTALWPADNRFIWAGDLGRMLGAVRADRMWVGLNGCHAAGLSAPGLEGANRVVTYASQTPEKAYEDPAVRHSVMGYFLHAEGLRDRQGDQNGDGRVSLQEAFAWAQPRATARTSGERLGPQRPVMVDGLGGREFGIQVTGAPAPPPSAAPPSAGGGAGEGPAPERRGLLRLPRLLR